VAAAGDDGENNNGVPPAGGAPPPPPPGDRAADGYDVSYPQCSASLPTDGAFAIVGVNNGLPFSANPCLTSQFNWAASKPGAAGQYINTANPGPISVRWPQPGPRPCVDASSYSDTGCAYNYGWSAASDAFTTAARALAPRSANSYAWWLDVETANSWNGTAAANSAAIQGYLDHLRTSRAVATVGVYSTGYQWGVITGGYALPTTPNWVAGASDAASAPSYCTATFTGGPVKLVQYPRGAFDGNYACP
jgi:hypothetical protein